MYAQVSRPRPVILILIVSLIGGVFAIMFGSTLLRVASMAGLVEGLMGGLFGFLGQGAGGSSLPFSAGTLELVAYGLMIGGAVQLAAAYLVVERRDAAKRQWVAVLSALLGVILLAIAVKSGALGSAFWAMSSLVGQIVNPFTVGVLDLVVAVLLYSNREVLGWFGGGRKPPEPDPQDEEIRRLKDALRRQEQMIQALLAEINEGKRPPEPDHTILLTVPQAYGYLVNRTRGGSQAAINLKNWNKFGRSPECGIKTHTPSSSKEHAIITFEGQRFYLTDMNSKAGTYVNGQRVTAKRQLFGNDEIRMGEDVFVFMQVPQARG